MNKHMDTNLPFAVVQSQQKGHFEAFLARWHYRQILPGPDTIPCDRWIDEPPKCVSLICTFISLHSLSDHFIKQAHNPYIHHRTVFDLPRSVTSPGAFFPCLLSSNKAFAMFYDHGLVYMATASHYGW